MWIPGWSLFRPRLHHLYNWYQRRHLCLSLVTVGVSASLLEPYDYTFTRKVRHQTVRYNAGKKHAQLPDGPTVRRLKICVIIGWGATGRSHQNRTSNTTRTHTNTSIPSNFNCVCSIQHITRQTTEEKKKKRKMVRGATFLSSLVVTAVAAAACVFAGSAVNAFDLPTTVGQRRIHIANTAGSSSIATDSNSQWSATRLLQQSQMKLSSTLGDKTSASVTEEEEDEFHQSNPAGTTPQFLSGLWQLIAQGNTLVRGVSSVTDKITERNETILLGSFLHPLGDVSTFLLIFPNRHVGIPDSALSKYGSGIYSPLFKFGDRPSGLMQRCM